MDFQESLSVITNEASGKASGKMSKVSQKKQDAGSVMLEDMSTESMSEPMLPINLCLNLIKVLPVDEVQQVLMEIVSMLSTEELTSLSSTAMIRYMAAKGVDSSFIPKDFSQKVTGAMEKLHKEGVGNLLYYIALWFMAGKYGQGRGDVTIQTIVNDVAGNQLIKQMHKRTSGRPRGRPKKVVQPDNSEETKEPENKASIKEEMQDKENKDSLSRLEEIKEIHLEAESDQTEDDLGRRKSRRKNKGKNPVRFEENVEWSADEDEVSDDDWQMNQADKDIEKEDTSMENVPDELHIPAGRRGRPPREDPSIYKCHLCPEEHKKYRDFRKHLDEHEKEDWPRCTQCPKVHLFKTKELLKEHEQDKHSPVVCEICGKNFRSKYTLIKHGVMHGKAPMFSCPSCGKGFSSRYNLKIHVNVYHKGIKPFLCSECGQGFTSKISLTEHTNTHFGLKPFKCEECGLTFARKATRRIHMMNEHNNSKGNVECDVCHKVYRNIYNLNQHMKLHSRVQHDKEMPMCDMCGRKFKGKYELEKHKKVVHLKIKEFKCDFCGKAFATRVHLQEHRAVHTREAQFFCEVCGEGFIHRVTYKAHVFRHNGTKQCVCPLCNKKFDVPRFLVRHIKDVHRGQPMPELPKFQIPKSSLAKHLRSDKKTVKKVDPPTNPVIGREARRPVAKSAAPNEIPAQLEVIEMHLNSAEEGILQPAGETENMQEIVHIFENMDEVKEKLDSGELGQQQIILQDPMFIEQDGTIKHEGQQHNTLVNIDGAETTYMEEGEQSRLLEIEIDGKREMIHVPASADYVQVGDKIIALNEILG